MIANQESLFPEEDKVRYGDKRRRRNLFLPKYLEDESIDYRLRDEAQDRAHEIMCKWANLESDGRLLRKKETTIEAEFLTDVFGKALGYVLLSDNKKSWNLEPKFSVNGGIADAALGLFEDSQERHPFALIELKGPNVNLDRDRFQGRTAVQQCWDYLNAVPQCPWGIVSNYVSFRLYHRNHTPRAYQLFVLQDLRKKEIFRQFYYLLEHEGLLPIEAGRTPRASQLLQKTGERQREVGDELYGEYHRNRVDMIQHLSSKKHNKPLENAIGITQKLLDRIIFVAFCEDRDLLPQNSIHRAYSQLTPFDQVTNPRWQNFLRLFRSIDSGNEKHGIAAYNGGLFRRDKEVDDLNLEDNWTNFFEAIGRYDFRDEVNVDILGHLFEKSINDIERIRLGGLFEPLNEDEIKPQMAKSAERKRGGIYYTPRQFTEFIAFNTVAKVIHQRIADVSERWGLKQDDLISTKPSAEKAKFWYECFEALRKMKIVDPACGSGAFLIAAYEIFDDKYQEIIDNLDFHKHEKAKELIDQIPDIILRNNLFGVDLSREAVEITQLALWLRSAVKGKTLADLSRNVVQRNSLVSDPNVDPLAMDWEEVFPEIFSRSNPGFDCVIGNPPWERMKLQEREFFNGTAPHIAAAVNAASRRKLIAELEDADLGLYQRYVKAKNNAESALDHVRNSGRYPLTGKGDINTYAAFAELAHSIVAPQGRVGLLLPSGIATDHTTKEFFGELIEQKTLIGLYDFENKVPIFPDVHRSFKFCVLLLGGQETESESADFVFFARQIEELKDNTRKIQLSAKDIKLLNPNTRTCPIFRSRRDAELTKTVYRRVPVLIDENRTDGGNPWGIKFYTMFHQTNDAEFFKTADELKADGFKRAGSCWKKRRQTFLPLYEAKMIQMYDHRAASVVIADDKWFRQGQTDQTSLVAHQNPEYSVTPRWWASGEDIKNALPQDKVPALLAFKNVTSPTNLRTMIAAFIPRYGVINSAPLICFQKGVDVTLRCCLLANLNSFALDYVARQKIGNVNLNFYLIEQFPMFTPDFYASRCPWDLRHTLANWISRRVLKLTCTANDMKPLAEASGFEPPVHGWKPEERANLLSELDAAYFLMYGIKKPNVEYILSTFSGTTGDAGNMFGSLGITDTILKYYDQLREKSK